MVVETSVKTRHALSHTEIKIPEGFKQTEVGVIPVDWEVTPIHEVIYIMTNGFVGSIKPFYAEHNNGVLYIQGYNVLENGFKFKGIKYVTKAFHDKHQKSKLREGDLLTVQTGNIGVTTVVPKSLEGSNCHALIITRFKQDIINSTFYAYYFNSKIGRYQLKEIETGSTMKHINVGHMKDLKIPLPPTRTEQTAIATALSDMDGLIEGLEKLLVKKRNIKQGAMQELLKPKDGWEVKTLREIALFRRGSFPQPYGLSKWYDNENGMPFVQVYDVGNNMKLKETTKQKISDLAKSKSVLVRKGTVILTIQGSIGRIAITQYDSFLDRTLLIFTNYLIPMDKVFFMYMVHQLFQKEKQKAPGGTIKTITKDKLSDFKLHYPKLDEQIEIAKTLHDMYTEIEQLETQLSKYKMLKTGMMQELLTGKKRLV